MIGWVLLDAEHVGVQVKRDRLRLTLAREKQICREPGILLCARPRRPTWPELASHDGQRGGPRRRGLLSHPLLHRRSLEPITHYLIDTWKLTSTRESPRWYLTKDIHPDAYSAISILRHEKVQAARDLFYTHVLLEAERETQRGATTLSRIRELFTVRRNRNAVVASEIVMFMQRFCGVNVIAYYSSEVFLAAGLGEVPALAASLGFGVINWLFALPAFFTIDRFGRRPLLLATFPLMALALLFTGFSFWIPEPSSPAGAHVACVALGIYLFGTVYSPGAGPVPFTYSAEAYPLYLRPLGMSLATATTWFFNFVLSVTWPSMLAAFKPQGAFGWYAGWNVVGFFGVLLLVPETRERTLEELDAVFGVSAGSLVRYGLASLRYFFDRRLFARDVEPPAVPHESLEARLDEDDVGSGGDKEKQRQLQKDATARV